MQETRAPRTINIGRRTFFTNAEIMENTTSATIKGSLLLTHANYFTRNIVVDIYPFIKIPEDCDKRDAVALLKHLKIHTIVSKEWYVCPFI